MNIFVDDEKVKTAARRLYDLDQSYGEGDEKPSLSVYEAAVAKWAENAVESILNEPDYFAYGANRILSYSTWDQALSHAQHWHQHPLTPNGNS